MVLYLASTLYHSAKDIRKRRRLRILDHASIYLLIAGSYTPFTLLSLPPNYGLPIFFSIWMVAAIGIVLKLFYTGEYDVLSTIAYVIMGWVAVISIKPLIASLDWNGVLLLFVGGAAYTLGALIYALNRIRFNHAVFHVFVLIGSLCHFLSVFLYVPSSF